MGVALPALTRKQQILTHFFKEEDVSTISPELLEKAFLARGVRYSYEVTSGNSRFYYTYKSKMEYKKSGNKEILFIFVLCAYFSSMRENSEREYSPKVFHSLSEKAYCFERENDQGESGFSYKRCCHWLNKDGKTIKMAHRIHSGRNETHFPCFQSTELGSSDFKVVPYAHFFRSMQNSSNHSQRNLMVMGYVETEEIKEVLKGSSRSFTRFKNVPRLMINRRTK